MQRLFYAFAIGASFPASVVTQLYLATAHDRARSTAYPSLTTMGHGVRLAYGVANVINVQLGNTIESAALVGAVLGLALSLIGRYKLGLPQTLFGMTKATEWRVHVIAPVLYAAIFVIIVRTLNTLIPQ